MGQMGSNLTEDDLTEYHELTGFSNTRVLMIHKRFYALAPEIVEQDRNARLPKELIITLPELANNPFQDRLLKIFSSAGDGSMTFDDYLEMKMIFSEHASFHEKAECAFKIYDFDDDGIIDPHDVRKLIQHLASEPGYTLDVDERDRVVRNVMKDIDLAQVNFINFETFQHAMNKQKNFTETFCMKL